MKQIDNDNKIKKKPTLYLEKEKNIKSSLDNQSDLNP